MPETIKLLGNSERRINKDKNGDNVLQSGLASVVLVHSNLVNNAYHHDSKFSYTFTANKPFGCLNDILPSIFIFLEAFKSKF